MNMYEVPYECCRIEELKAGDRFMLIELYKYDTWRYEDEQFISFLKKQTLTMVEPDVKERKKEGDPSSRYNRVDRDGALCLAHMSHGAMVRRVV